MRGYDVMKTIDCKRLIDSIFKNLSCSYKEIDKNSEMLYKGIIARKIDQLYDELGRAHIPKTHENVLVMYFGSKYIRFNEWSDIIRYALFDRKTLCAIASYRDFECMDFYYNENSPNMIVFDINDDTVETLAELTLPNPLCWDWENPVSIFMSPMIGTAKKYPKTATVELLTRYIEYSLKRIPANNEMMITSAFIPQPYHRKISIYNDKTEEYIDWLRLDVLLNKLGLYKELRAICESKEAF